MNDLIEPTDPFSPPRVRGSVPFWTNVAQVVAAVIFAISGSMVFGGLMVGLFVGPHILPGALLWVIPAALSGYYVLRWLKSE